VEAKMKKLLNVKKMELGQVIPLIVLMMLVIIAMVGLILDGGSIMSNRRTAQASADAGAMAGAKELCYPTGLEPLVVAEKYAYLNGAENANAVLENGRIRVITTVINDSFFAKIFDQNTLSASAEAIAGCIPPSGQYVLPLTWSCRPNISGDDDDDVTSPFDEDFDCQVMTLDWEYIEPFIKQGPGTTFPIDEVQYQIHSDKTSIVKVSNGEPPPHIYIIMDTEKTGNSENDYTCKEEYEEEHCIVPDPKPDGYDSAIRCDLDCDGKYDIETGGNRGWLDLDMNRTTGGVIGAAELKSWIENGFDGKVQPCTWLTGQPGTIAKAVEHMQTYRQGKVAWVPVFNAICNEKDACNDTDCVKAAQEGSSCNVCYNNKNLSEPKYHIVTFAPFYVSCVKNNPNDSCPGFDLFVKLNPHLTKGTTQSLKAVEGYFLRNVVMLYDGEENCDINLGNCQTILTE
jgi:hypothetical protein